MADFNVRADHIDVEQIMRQIRARIRDKRGADYTEAEIRELASVKLDKFLDPRAVRSSLLQHYRGEGKPAPLITPEEAHPPLWDFNPQSVYVSDRGVAGKILTFIRKILKPFSKLLFHVDTVWDVLTKQSVINRQHATLFQRVHNRMMTLDALNFEMFNNLVVEITRLSIENKNLRMQVESFGTRLDFDERRARALEGVVQYRPGAPVARPQQPSLPAEETGAADDETTEGGDTRSARRRRRRRGRRRGAGEGGDQAQGAREQGAREPGAHEQAGQTSERQQGGYDQGGPREQGGAHAYAMPSAEPQQSHDQHEHQEQQPGYEPQHEQPHTIEQAPGGEPAGEPHYHSYAEPPVTPASSPAHAPEGEAERQAAPSWEQPAPPAVEADAEQAQAEQAAPGAEQYQPYEPSPSDRPAPQRVFDTPRRSDTDSGEPGSSQS